MGLFGASSPFDADVEKATSEKNTSEQWGIIMDICDKVGQNSINAKECLKSIVKRLNHYDPHVVVQAITLLDACVNNCGKNFHLEIASRDFENEYKKLVSKSQPQLAAKLRSLLKKWSEGDFKSDPQLNLIPSLYHKLKNEGQEFVDTTSVVPKVQPVYSKDPNVVSSQQEEEDIAKAIELSLKDKGGQSKSQPNLNTSNSLYPSMALTGGALASGLSPSLTTLNSTMTSSSNSTNFAEPRKVRALYDFEAAEDNELTFKTGEIIHVIDDSDPNWWKGYNKRGEGLFPSNFVTADLNIETDVLSNDKNKKTIQFNNNDSDNDKNKTVKENVIIQEINEEKIDRLLHLLHEADPEEPSQDTEEMLNLEAQVNLMGPLIDAELERVDRKHAQLTQLSSDLVDAINLYHTLMRDSDRPGGFINFPQQQPGSMYAPPGYGGIQGMSTLYHNLPNVYQLPGQLPGAAGPMQGNVNALQGMPPQGSMLPGGIMGPPPPPMPQQVMHSFQMNTQQQNPQQQHQQHTIPHQLQNGHLSNQQQSNMPSNQSNIPQSMQLYGQQNLPVVTQQQMQPQQQNMFPSMNSQNVGHMPTNMILSNQMVQHPQQQQQMMPQNHIMQPPAPPPQQQQQQQQQQINNQMLPTNTLPQQQHSSPIHMQQLGNNIGGMLPPQTSHLGTHIIGIGLPGMPTQQITSQTMLQSANDSNKNTIPLYQPQQVIKKNDSTSLQ